MPGQTVSVSTDPRSPALQPTGDLRRSPSEPVGSRLKALHESTPQRMRVGCIAAERAWMSNQ